MKNSFLLAIVILTASSLCIAKNRQVHLEVKTTNLEPTTNAAWSLSEEEASLYHKELAISKIEGCAILSFEISTEGKVKEIEVVKTKLYDNSKNKKNRNSKKLRKYSKKAIRKLKWSIANKNPDNSEKRVMRLDYCMDKTWELVSMECAKRVESTCE